MIKLGFIGLGTLGGRITKRLLDSGYQVAGYNRTQSKAEPLVKAGLQLCRTPREVAQVSEITFSMVTDNNALMSIADGPDGVIAGLSTGKIYVDMSTVSPQLIRELAQRVASTGAAMLEAPVSGSVPAAESGTFTFFVGGDSDVLDQVRPILEKLGQKIIHVGTNGQGAATKLAINLSIPIQLIALFEGVLLAERSGLSRQVALDALLNSVIASPAIKYRAPLILKMPDEVWFNVAMMQKDIQLALEMGEELGVPLQSAQLSNEILSRAIAEGYSQQDFAVLFQVLAHMAGSE